MPILKRLALTLASRHPNPIPASFLRGGTSKGIFLHRKHLPLNKSEWLPIFLGLMGSPDPEYGRQLNGMGGGVSSLSKICVIEPPTPDQHSNQGIDLQYTFVQVGIRDSSIDYSGNCGNLTSMIGAYGVDEKMVPEVEKRRDEDGRARIRCFNTNTKKVIDMTFPISEHGVPVLNLEEATVAGVPGVASRIVCEYLDPAGARTGKLLPTNESVTELDVELPTGKSTKLSASLVDATNPSIFILANDLRQLELDVDNYVKGKEDSTLSVTKTLEAIRQQGARTMKLDPTAQAQPKIAFLTSPTSDSDLSDKVDVVVHALSMGVLHKAVPMTLGLCLGVAAKVKDTLAWNIVQTARQKSGSDNEFVRIRHPGGIVDVGAEITPDGIVKSAKVVRTGRRLMKGVVWW